MNMLTASGPQASNPAAPDPLDGAFSANWLAQQYYPPTEYVVPGLIAEGASILVAAPKIGKSWMVLGIAIAAAEGGHAFGSIPVTQRPVLYLALEDGPRRLQSRMRMLGTSTPPDLIFMTDLDTAVDETVSAFLARYEGRKPLAILDTLGKVRGTYGGNDAYGNDYTQLGNLKTLVDRHPGSSLLIVHHTNKGEKTDFLESVSGTQGIAGAVDSILAIRRDRNTERGTLSVAARDANEGEYAMDMRDGTWTLVGGDLDSASRAAATGETTKGLGDLQQRILAAVDDAPNGITPLGVSKVVADCDNKKAGTYLARLLDQGRIRKDERGKYFPLPTGDAIPELEAIA